MNQLYAKVVLSDPSAVQPEQNQPHMSQLRQMNAAVNINNNIDYLVGEIRYLKQSLSILRQFYAEQCAGSLQQMSDIQKLVNKYNNLNLHNQGHINQDNNIQIQQFQQQINQLVNDKHNVINQFNKQIQDLNVELSNKDDEIEYLKRQLQEKDIYIKKLNNEKGQMSLVETIQPIRSPQQSGLQDQSIQSLNARAQLNMLNKSIENVVQGNMQEKQALQQQINTIEDQYQKLQYEYSVSNLKASQAQATVQDLIQQVQQLRVDKEKLQQYLYFCMLSYQKRYNEKLDVLIEKDDSLLSDIEETNHESKQDKKFSESKLNEFGALYDECESLRKQLLEYSTNKSEIMQQNSVLQIQNSNLQKENAKLLNHLEQQSLSNIDVLKQKQLQTELEVLQHHVKTQTMIADNLKIEHQTALERVEKLETIKLTQEKVIQSLQQNFNASLSLITRYQEQFVEYNKNIASYASETTIVIQNQMNKLIEEQTMLQILVQQVISKFYQDPMPNQSLQSNNLFQDFQSQSNDYNAINKILTEVNGLKEQFYAQLENIQQNKQLLLHQNAMLSQINDNKAQQSDKEQKLLIKNLDSALQQAKNNKEQILQQLLHIVKIIKDNDEVFQQLRLEFTFLDDVYKAIKYTGRIAQ